MPRNYQPKHNNPYVLPHNLYMHVLYLVRDYDRLKTQQDDIIFSSGVSDGMPRGTQTGDPTGNKAIQVSFLSSQIQAIENALLKIPAEYRKGVFDQIRYGGWFPFDADASTYRRWKQRFLYWVCVNLNYI